MEREGPRQRLKRRGLGLLWSLKPPRLWGVPATLLLLAKHYAGLGPPPGVLPDPETALRTSGLVEASATASRLGS